MKAYNIAFYGPVDSGKTSILEQFCGPVNKYAHEIKGSITTVLGATSYTLSDRQGCTRTIHLVDTPGHKMRRHSTYASLYFINHAMILLNPEKPCDSNIFIDMCKLIGCPYTIIFNKIDTYDFKTVGLKLEAFKKLYGVHVLPYTIFSDRARQNLEDFMANIQKFKELDIAPGIFHILKSYNPVKPNTTINNIGGAIVGGIGKDIHTGETLMIHGVRSLTGLKKTVKPLKILNIRKTGVNCKVLNTPEFYSMETSMLPDFAAQDALQGLFMTREGNNLESKLLFMMRDVKKYAALKKGGQYGFLYRGRRYSATIKDVKKGLFRTSTGLKIQKNIDFAIFYDLKFTRVVAITNFEEYRG